MEENNEHNIKITKETIEVDVKKDVIDKTKIKAKIKSKVLLNKIERLISNLEFLIILIIYIILSLTVKSEFCPYVKNGWGYWWILFFILPIGPHIYRAIKYRRLSAIPTFSVCLAIFLTLGMTLKLWHPAWIIFLVIPIFYTIISIIKTAKLRKKFNDIANQMDNQANNSIDNQIEQK